jgi:preprotein translocase subunit SecG
MKNYYEKRGNKVILNKNRLLTKFLFFVIVFIVAIILVIEENDFLNKTQQPVGMHPLKTPSNKCIY